MLRVHCEHGEEIGNCATCETTDWQVPPETQPVRIAELERECDDLRTLVGVADHYFEMAKLDGSEQDDLFRAYCKMKDAADAYKRERAKYRSTPSASEQEDEACTKSILRGPAIPCIFRKDHEGTCSFDRGHDY